MALVTRMQELQASRRGNQWHPQVQFPVEKRAPYREGRSFLHPTLVAAASASPTTAFDGVQV
jgi:hypothetical protein